METYSKAAWYYDKLYEGKDYAGEVERLIELACLRPADGSLTLLDVACGTGRHIEHLRGRFSVEGLDICPELLDDARRRNPGVLFHHGDMTSFDLGRRFDAVVCLFSAIGYASSIGGLRSAVSRMAVHLAPGGVLAIEPWFTPADWRPGTTHGLYIDEPDLKIARVNTSMVRGRMSVLDMHYLIGTPEGTEHLEEHHELALFEREEMEEAFHLAGLGVRFDPQGLTGRGLYLGRAAGS
ncbi:MAG: class I SAM-dependent methyltransferase [Candidatus Fermentibacter sp.]|nr:class I SAM-dependent methyltransferase [Candidatus Fermentibacter sp.]